MSTAVLGAASAMLAFGKPLAMPFAPIVGKDLALLIQVPVPLTLLVLVAGAAIVERVARRMRVNRPSTLAATHLGLASFFLVAYASFPFAFWPAFAENRFDLGFDLRSAGRWVITSWVIYLLVALGVAVGIGRKATTSESPSRAPRIALVAIALLTCVSAIVAARRIKTHPSGYLGSLTPITLTAEGPPLTQVGSLCIWRAQGGDPLHGISIAQLARGATCPEEPTRAATKYAVGTRLLHDAKHDVFFEPSKYHQEEAGYLSQLAGRDIVTMRDVGAPPPRMLVYSAILTLLLTLALDFERWRGRALRPSSVAMVAAFAAPLVVATIIGV